MARTLSGNRHLGYLLSRIRVRAANVLNCRTWLMAVLLLANVSTAVFAAEEEWRFPTDEITPEQWQTYLDETLAIPGVQPYESGNQLVIEVRDEHALYVFTTPGHPAHPAVVKRVIIQKDGAFYIGRKGHFAGDRAAYDAWWHQFDELDRRIKEAAEKARQ